ncbi:hypothetical protein KSC_018870 [Ktedonobacter sp. SOSP1-52]|uniref:tetratricopeptide repeat protein n=1 Tax=Ktedonobacter sp. SOSP1-52 TaxID=2778366 RepID=UPI001915AC01|nr:tetratricopeptide repeat protein [Ktedonobacter sp. SOSP1-52]GHO62995.1 hypothetical protein KSC_018870 [Ktedonobacter sp. SOSP1-52]
MSCPEYWSEFTSLLLKLGGNDLVRDMLKRVIQRHPTLSEVWFQLASCSAYNDHFVAAHQQYSRAIKFTPNNAFAYAMRALCDMEMKHFNSALVDCRRAIALDPEHYLPWQTRGNIFLELGQPERAYQAFTQLIELRPNNASSWQKRALASYRAHNYVQAIDDCTRALALDAQLAETYLTRAQSHKELAHLAESEADYQVYLNLQPEDAKLL